MQLVQVAASLELQPKSGARATCQSLTCLMVNELGQAQTGPRQACLTSTRSRMNSYSRRNATNQVAKNTGEQFEECDSPEATL